MSNLSETSDGVKREFDQLAPSYESNRLSPWYKAHTHLLEKYCPDTLQGDILDIGCASGYTSRLLSKKYPDCNVVGLDLSPKMIERAQHQLSDNLLYLNDNWENPSKLTAKTLQQFDFQLIVCANAFHYFNEPKKSLEAMFKILRNNGTLLLLERDKANSLLTSLWGFLHHYFIKDQVHFYTADELVTLFKSAGFDQVETVNVTKKYFWNKKLYTSIAIFKCYKQQA